jgi:putative glutamine amidotransferase
MKKILIVFLILIGFIEIDAQTKSFKRIGLINPVAWNLEKVIYLIHHKYIDVDSFQIIGIFPDSQKEQLAASKKFAAEHDYRFISFELLHHQIPVDSLFLDNRCTADFIRIFKKTDAMIFLGGDDIYPKLYGEKTFLTTQMIPAEQSWEMSFLYHLTGGFQNDSFIPLLVKRQDYLIVGICLGMQEMNVASGGTLYQDIPYQIYGETTYDDITQQPIENQHRNFWNRIDNMQPDVSGMVFHHIKIVKNSYLNFISSNSSPLVASAHHQCVKKTGKNFVIAAISMDEKVIEAFSNEKFKNVYGIQFHTDFPALYEDTMKFKISPNQTFQLNKEDKQFYIDFWKDFSRRLKEQK